MTFISRLAEFNFCETPVTINISPRWANADSNYTPIGCAAFSGA